MNPRQILVAAMLLGSVASADLTVILPDPEIYADTSEGFLIETTLPGTFKTPEGVIAALLTLGDQAKNKKLENPFTPEALRGSSHFEGAKPLAAYYRGARIKDKEFIVSFSGEAMRYLNNTAGIQEFVKGSLVATVVKNFPAVKTVQYEIDGEIVTDWDA
ncbi:hypothetical protein OJ996_20190 [Luteolibacter sp. GHJ8]|jgi:hypothetical protein|uniref:Uncharacterized protein n=1 Tax=Luteolibacter rhizosphaerae TaxID=2989719 RepID=A0ABT3G7U3_9BACT|nr:hypothetical protein [Luteolibacter rhizosphaerae]MCW1915919.1 hypothetical protein [Luteolibacter rhizosphaerae]